MNGTYDFKSVIALGDRDETLRRAKLVITNNPRDLVGGLVDKCFDAEGVLRVLTEPGVSSSRDARELALALTHLETARMRLNNYLFTGRGAQAREHACELAATYFANNREPDIEVVPDLPPPDPATLRDEPGSVEQVNP